MFVAELIFIHMAGAGGTMQASRVSVIMLQGLGISPPLARMLAEDGFNDGAATGATQPMVSPTWRR